MNETAKFQISDVYRWNKHSTKRIKLNQGGLSSSKTYSILQNLIRIALTDNKSISVVGISSSHLSRGAMRDFKNIMMGMGIWDDKRFKGTQRTYYFHTGAYIEFFSVDDPTKARGPRRDILFINEANLLPFETYRQLSLRTHDLVWLDYNPADEFHWIYDKVMDQPNCDFLKSTFKDNPFLSDDEILEILGYREADPTFWKVYGLGERGSSKATIFSHWKTCNSIPDEAELQCYGVDFGENSPTAIIKVSYDKPRNRLYWEEKLYRRYVSSDELVELCKDSSIIDNRRLTMFVDPGDKEIKSGARKGEVLKQAGFKVKYAEKPVNPGIQTIKSCEWFISTESVNCMKEVKSYKWQEDYKRDLILDWPVKANDHAMDAGRYGTYNMLRGLIKNKVRGRSKVL